jgi:hypothetical protein
MKPHGIIDETEALLLRAAEKGLGSRTRLRLLAVTLWASFLGGIPILLTWLALLPDDVAAGLGIADLSMAFLLWWVAAAIPTSIGVLLTHPGSMPEMRRGADKRHG